MLSQRASQLVEFSVGAYDSREDSAALHVVRELIEDLLSQIDSAILIIIIIIRTNTRVESRRRIRDDTRNRAPIKARVGNSFAFCIDEIRHHQPQALSSVQLCSLSRRSRWPSPFGPPIRNTDNNGLGDFASEELCDSVYLYTDLAAQDKAAATITAADLKILHSSSASKIKRESKALTSLIYKKSL